MDYTLLRDEADKLMRYEVILAKKKRFLTDFSPLSCVLSRNLKILTSVTNIQCCTPWKSSTNGRYLYLLFLQFTIFYVCIANEKLYGQRELQRSTHLVQQGTIVISDCYEQPLTFLSSF